MHPHRREYCALRFFMHFLGRRDSSLRPFCAQKKMLELRRRRQRFSDKEVGVMTLNILFFTVTIRQRKVSLDDALRNEMAREAYENMKNRTLTVHRLF